MLTIQVLVWKRSMIRFFLAMFLVIGLAPQAMAQNASWIQVEAKRSLADAQETARAYSSGLENVAGFAFPGRWYGIAIGPYSRSDAETLLRQLRRSGRIPADSFLVTTQKFRQQFWPVGIGAPTTPQPLPETNALVIDDAPLDLGLTGDVPAVADIEVLAPQIAIPDETPREARASEAALTRDERKNLQSMLQWAGFYDAAIDGAFGRGTRGSMRAWQQVNGHEPTGILTTGQRTELATAYNAILDGLGLTLVNETTAGIEMLVPTGVVAFDRYDPPFARFTQSGDIDATVLMISQQGDQDRLFGLYEIMQTLKIIPTNGPRNRKERSFEIEGIDDDIHSYTFAELRDGMIKGFSLVWPAGDEERRSRVLAEMRNSYVTTNGVLQPSDAPASDIQSIDLVSGLEIRRPKLSRSGFYVSEQGAVLTTLEATQSCDRITFDGEHEAEVIAQNDESGLAVLAPFDILAPANVAVFQTGVPRLQSQVAVAGYPYGGVLAMPSLTFGTLADLRGLDGNETIKRLDLTVQMGDAGGPVFDNGGTVMGMLQTRAPRDGQVLPKQVNFSVNSSEILATLDEAGIVAQTSGDSTEMAPEAMTEQASLMAVLVSCW